MGDEPESPLSPLTSLDPPSIGAGKVIRKMSDGVRKLSDGVRKMSGAALKKTVRKLSGAEVDDLLFGDGDGAGSTNRYSPFTPDENLDTGERRAGMSLCLKAALALVLALLAGGTAVVFMLGRHVEGARELGRAAAFP